MHLFVTAVHGNAVFLTQNWCDGVFPAWRIFTETVRNHWSQITQHIAFFTITTVYLFYGHIETFSGKVFTNYIFVDDGNGNIVSIVVWFIMPAVYITTLTVLCVHQSFSPPLFRFLHIPPPHSPNPLTLTVTQPDPNPTDCSDCCPHFVNVAPYYLWQADRDKTRIYWKIIYWRITSARETVREEVIFSLTAMRLLS